MLSSDRSAYYLRSYRRYCFFFLVFSVSFHSCISDNTNEIAKSIFIIKYAWQKWLYFKDTHTHTRTHSGKKKFCVFWGIEPNQEFSLFLCVCFCTLGYTLWRGHWAKASIFSPLSLSVSLKVADSLSVHWRLQDTVSRN